jgi:hypothetical protein
MTDRDALAQEPDRVPARRLAAIGAAGLLVFAVGGLWVGTVQRGVTGTVRSDTAPRPALAGQREVGMVYQRRFGESLAAAKNEEARRRLDGAGWVDKGGGVAHVPIAQAMEIVVRRGKL